MSDVPKTEERGLRLFQLSGQADALLSSVDIAWSFEPTGSAPGWLRDAAERLFREVESCIPDPDYFRHISGKKMFSNKGKHDPSMFEIRTALACAQVAAHQFAEPGVPQMGFKNPSS